MNKQGPVIILEDNLGDKILYQEAFKELEYRNEIIFFTDGQQALSYLNETDIEPFIVLSDINMPRLNGMELRGRIYENEKLREKCIPFLFFSTSNNQKDVIDAYSKSVQGFFIKPSSYDRLLIVIRTIMEYWIECLSPDFVD